MAGVLALVATVADRAGGPRQPGGGAGPGADRGRRRGPGGGGTGRDAAAVAMARENHGDLESFAVEGAEVEVTVRVGDARATSRAETASGDSCRRAPPVTGGRPCGVPTLPPMAIDPAPGADARPASGAGSEATIAAPAVTTDRTSVASAPPPPDPIPAPPSAGPASRPPAEADQGPSGPAGGHPGRSVVDAQGVAAVRAQPVAHRGGRRGPAVAGGGLHRHDRQLRELPGPDPRRGHLHDRRRARSSRARSWSAWCSS